MQPFVEHIDILGINDAHGTLKKYATPLPRFTTRQREIATYAFRHGFFETPRKIAAEELAKHFQISVSAINEHLRKIDYLTMKFFFS
jgi:predicted DNA binding protein